MSRLERKVESQQELIEAQQERIERLQSLIDAMNGRLAALEGASPTETPAPTHTPTATNTPVTAIESTPIATPTSTAIPALTPTRTTASTLAPGCIGKIGLGWLTGAWNSACQTAKTPPTAKAGIRYARYYAFTLDTPKSVTINISSSDVRNAYLYLLDGRGAQGNIVSQNDAQIQDDLPAGTYTIEVTTYDTETAGAFTLTMDISTTIPVR